MTELFNELLKKRGVSEQFLNPKYEDCLDPFLLPDMRKAVERIRVAIDKKERILIYGDYDVDGVTATTILYDGLKLAGAKEIETMLPDRFLDGYGMNKKIIQYAKEKNVSLVITVDCGSANEEIINELLKNKIETIVTDHHECPEKIPKNAIAVVNPKRKDCEVENCLKDLAGAGVAFELIRGLVKKKMIPDGQEKWFLDLAMIGTICDSVKMTEENRRICFFGMKVLKKTRRTGLKELMKVAGVKRINSEVVGFQIGPRLNAAGRMESAERALKLLMVQNKVEAARIAKELDALNIERKRQQVEVVGNITMEGIEKDPVIVKVGRWHEGILGIVAGKLTEKYKKPAFVLTETKTGELKGSGRSFGEFNLAEALRECQNEILSGGGHAAACGLKVDKDKLKDFKEKVNTYYRSLKLCDQEKFLEKKEDLRLGEVSGLSLEFLDEIVKLEPFSEGNEEPVFLLEDVFLLEAQRMGTRDEHLRLLVRGKDGEQLKLVAFYAPEEWLKAMRGQRGDIWITLTSNEWNGMRNVEGRILKMRLVEEEIF